MAQPALRPYYDSGLQDIMAGQRQQKALGQTNGFTPEQLGGLIQGDFANQQSQQRANETYQLQQRQQSNLESEQKKNRTQQQYLGAAQLGVYAPAIYKGYADVFGGKALTQIGDTGMTSQQMITSGATPGQVQAISTEYGAGTSAIGGSAGTGDVIIGNTGMTANAMRAAGASEEVIAAQATGATGASAGTSIAGTSGFMGGGYLGAAGGAGVGYGVGYGLGKLLFHGPSATRNSQYLGDIGAVVGLIFG